MKLTSVELHPANSSEVATLSFRDPGAKNPFNVKTIFGLDADAIVPKHYSGSGDSSFHDLFLEDREIVIRIGLNPQFAEHQSYSDLRDSVYRLIASSRTGTLELRFMNGLTPVAAVSGFVSRLESPLFEKTQEVQITLKCDEPMLKAPTPVMIGYTEPSGSPIIVIEDTKSTAPHGFAFELLLLSDADYLEIRDPESFTWEFSINPVSGFLANDIITFSSEYNNKLLTRTRDGITVNIADEISLNSVWPIMFPGVNRFQLNTADVQWTEISYYPTYWGV